MTQQSALDGVVSGYRQFMSFNSNLAVIQAGRRIVPIDEVGRFVASEDKGQFIKALQDPRYIAFCKEQDRLAAKFQPMQRDPSKSLKGYHLKVMECVVQ